MGVKWVYETRSYKYDRKHAIAARLIVLLIKQFLYKYNVILCNFM